MRRLLQFILNNRGFFTFLLLELVCAWLIIQNNSFQGARYFNSSRAVAARMLSVTQLVNNYLHLADVNLELSQENTRLRQLLETKQGKYQRDTTHIRFDFVDARVVNNSVSLFRNFITIDKGLADGLAPGMAVINSNKAIGKVKAVSENYAVVISLLNLDENVSSFISRTGSLGSVKWDGKNPRYSDLNFIPRHVTPLPGDSIVTSGMNAIFPEKILVGVISRAHLKPDALFWDIQIELAQDFTRLQHVQVIKSIMKPEIDSLQNVVTPLTK